MNWHKVYKVFPNCQNMFELVDRYQNYFNIHFAKGAIQKIFFSFMLVLPHLLTCLILIALYPGQWLGILIIGLVLPDLSYFFHMFVHPAAIFKGNLDLQQIGEKRKKIAHLLTFILVMLFLINHEYILFLAGGIHLLLDILGF